MRVAVTMHAAAQALERHPDTFAALGSPASVFPLIERDVREAIEAGRVGGKLDGYSCHGGDGSRLAWTAGLERVYLVCRSRRKDEWRVVTALPRPAAEAAA